MPDNTGIQITQVSDLTGFTVHVLYILYVFDQIVPFCYHLNFKFIKKILISESLVKHLS